MYFSNVFLLYDTFHLKPKGKMWKNKETQYNFIYILWYGITIRTVYTHTILAIGEYHKDEESLNYKLRALPFLSMFATITNSQESSCGIKREKIIPVAWQNYILCQLCLCGPCLSIQFLYNVMDSLKIHLASSGSLISSFLYNHLIKSLFYGHCLLYWLV